MVITVYTFTNKEGTEDSYTTMDLQLARDRADTFGLLLTANTYTLEDSEVIADHRDDEEHPCPYMT